MVFFVDLLIAAVSVFLFSLPLPGHLFPGYPPVGCNYCSYVAIGEFKPYSLHFVETVFALHTKIKIQVKEAWKLALILEKVSTALAVFGVTAILLPGFVLSEVVMAPNVVNG